MFVSLALVVLAAGGEPAQGRALYRSNCAFCHGLDGRGGRGPNLLTSRVIREESDDSIRGIVRNGVPGSTMPAFQFEEDELSQLVAYLRQAAQGGSSPRPVAGDPTKGRAIYLRSGCPACHRIGQEGSVFGPDLTRIGSGRAVEYIRQSVVEPSADIPEEFEGVTVVTGDGRRVRGVRLNEDTFTVQLRDASQAFRMYRKDELREVIHETSSLMPAYKSLSKDDLDDLVAYLSTLRGAAASGGAAKRTERRR